MRVTVASVLFGLAVFVAPAWADPFIPASGSDTVVSTSGDDFATGPHALGFAFPFFGSSYTSVFMNSNGNLSFGAGFTTFTNAPFPVGGTPPLIAPFWDDLDLPPGSMRINGTTTGVFNALWSGVGFFGASGTVTAEATLFGAGNPFGFAPGTIVFSYGSVTNTNDGSVTVGLNAGNGTGFATLFPLGIGGASGVLGATAATGLVGPYFFVPNDSAATSYTVTRTAPVPEPLLIALLPIAFAGVGAWRRRRRAA